MRNQIVSKVEVHIVDQTQGSSYCSFAFLNFCQVFSNFLLPAKLELNQKESMTIQFCRTLKFSISTSNNPVHSFNESER